MASWVDAGPGSRLHAATASSKSRASSQRRRSTHSSRSSAMWVGGPPKPMQPMRPQSRRTATSPGALTVSGGLVDELQGVGDALLELARRALEGGIGQLVGVARSRRVGDAPVDELRVARRLGAHLAD